MVLVIRVRSFSHLNDTVEVLVTGVGGDDEGMLTRWFREQRVEHEFPDNQELVLHRARSKWGGASCALIAGCAPATSRLRLAPARNATT